MALRLPGQWVWDSWYVFDGERYHAFYLQASRGLDDPNRRHRNVTVGHAISDDLTNWTVVRDALAPSEPAAFDSWTTWTGSIIREDSGRWRMFYTGTSREDAGERQTVGTAVSDDLLTWTKDEARNPVAAADPRWYRTLVGGATNEPFRDPWVFKLPGESQWTMLTTAAAKECLDERQAGVMGIAKSDDLVNWQVLPPVGAPDRGFGETEVFQYAEVDGVTVLLFCCGPLWLSEARLGAQAEWPQGEPGGVYSVVVKPDLSDVDFARSHLYPDTTLYASRLVQGRDGRWNLMAFKNFVDGEFVGELSDPIPVTADPVRGIIPR